MPWKFSTSTAPTLESEIDSILIDLERNFYPYYSSTKSEFGCPPSKAWVLVDMATYSIIHRLFLGCFIVPNGRYMVIPAYCSNISVHEFRAKDIVVEALRLLDATDEKRGGEERDRKEDEKDDKNDDKNEKISWVTYLATAKLTFPSHEMPFRIQVPQALLNPESMEIETIINKIIEDINNKPGETIRGPLKPRFNQSILRGPTPTDWVVVDVEKTEIIPKCCLKDYIRRDSEYMVLSARSSAISGWALKSAIKELNSNSPANIPPQYTPSSYISVLREE